MKIHNKKSLSRLITLNFTLVIILSNVGLICSVFFLLRLELAEKDRNIATVRFHEISNVIEHGGIEMVKYESEKRAFSNLSNLLIVIVDRDGKKLVERLPQRLDNFDPAEIEKAIQKALKVDGALTIPPKEIFEETIELFAGDVRQYRIVVGIATDASEDFVHLYFKLAVFATLIFGSIGVAMGYYYARKSLRPIHDLIKTVKLVQMGSISAIETTSQSENELSELVKLFNEMIMHINKLISSLQNSLDGIAHDLRTPLTHISNRLQNIAKNEGGLVSKESAGDLLEETQSMTSLLNTLLEISEADSSSLVLKKERVQLYPIIKECLDLYEFIAEDKHATVQFECDEGIRVFVDRNRLKRVIANLYDNALKYTFGDPQISIRCSEEKDHVLISLQDNGVGISASDSQKIWQRLYRGDGSRTTQGMGLGLSFVKSIVEAHGWKIELKSAPGEGTLFTISIPNQV